MDFGCWLERLETERRYGVAKRAEGVGWMEVSNMDKIILVSVSGA